MKHKRSVERQIHFGVGNSAHTTCGLVLFSRHVMVSIHSGSDGALITDDMECVTCKRCLATKEARLRKLLAVEGSCPGIFDRESLCGGEWLLEHALDTSQQEIDAQKLEVDNGARKIVLSNTIKSTDRKYILKGITG